MRIERHQQDGTHRYECWDDYGCSILGRAIVLERDEHVYLQDMNVRPGYRGRGIGSGLLRQILSDFGDRPIVADVFEDRISWYRRHSFKPVGRTKNLVRVLKGA